MIQFQRLLISLIATSSFAHANGQADSLLINANIYGHPTANSVAITQGKISYIGSADGAATLKGSETEIIDLGNAFLLPGFIDNHNHVFEAASEAGGSCELLEGGTLSEQVPYLKDCREMSPTSGWITGYGFTIENLLSSQDETTPLEVLDSLFPNQPVVFMEQTSHSMWVNSLAFELSGFNHESIDPPGGKILKTKSGKFNGILLDNAGDIVMETAWNSLPNQFDQSYQGLMAGLEEAAAHGITTIGDGRLYWKRGWLEVWKAAEKSGDLTARVSLRPWIYPEVGKKNQLEYLESIYTDDHSNLLLVNQVKMYSDGILVNGTAKVLAPYLTTYIPNQPYGLNYISPKDMTNWLSELAQIGYSAHIHAIGDGAVRESLNAVEAMREKGQKQRYTFTHVELVDKADVPRFAKLNVTADFQVGSDYVAYNDHTWAEAIIGIKKAKSMMNLSTMFDHQVNVTLSSDWNVHDINPLVGIANSMKMKPYGLPDINAAIDAYTINAAYSLGLEELTGSIDLGKSADFVVLSDDITKMRLESIPNSRVLMTVLQGNVIYKFE
ncbi:amidohydrolase [Vibrio sp. SCSIO 43135]|uniref:amidohydrolase n=1 Tax=Vibrio sp. SCSIO 43135 TaxID=2819096 RepID=UPI002075F790|nr:amidohydrolase [Vibrio sp. SCSIO 43135]USD39981.1 amidohydrolase [Vibrio sp. SCSIO 43135]